MKKNKIYISFLTPEPFIGIGIINSNCVGKEEEIYSIHGLELGFLFFKLTFARIGDQIS
jgi:hypothetical protein